jgi:hypothetical protein
MRRTVFAAVGCFLFILLVILASPSIQLKKEIVAKVPQAYISSVSQSYYALAIDLILNGKNFPPKVGSGNIRRNIRLVSMGGAGDAKGYVFYAGETGNWTPVRIDDVLPLEVLAGRKYKIGLVQFEAPGPNIKTLISNEVDFFLLMNLDSVTPNPVPFGTTQLEVTTANTLGPQGSKIVKFGSFPAQVTQWGSPASSKFKFIIPHGLAVPGSYLLYVEENGSPVSRKVVVQLLGAKSGM